jgi:hypothetical protein
MNQPARITLCVAAACALGLTHAVHAAPVDLNTWAPESYDSVGGFPDGLWTVAVDGSSVTQSQNGQPTAFYSNFTAFGTKVTGRIRVDGGDDDFIGFLIGFQPGDSSDSSADFLMVDWKRGTQSFDFGGGPADDTPGSTAPAGLAVSHVTGVPTADELWGHFDHAPQTDGTVTELQRAFNLGSTGWVNGTEYEFSFDFGPNDLEVSVDGVLELDITGNFANGRLAFYNFSQAGVTYSAFDIEEGTFPEPEPGAVPEPGSLALAGLGLALAAIRRRRRR